MEIQEVTLNIPLQYKAMQCRKENIEELRDWIANEDGFNAFVMLLNVHVASHLPERFRAAVQFDGRSREITTEKQYLLVTPRFINDLDINWHATPYVPTWRDIRANDWVVAYKKKD